MLSVHGGGGGYQGMHDPAYPNIMTDYINSNERTPKPRDKYKGSGQSRRLALKSIP